MKKRYGCLLLILILLTGLTGALAGPDLTLRDTSSRSGLWAEAYSRILTERAEGVRAYQAHVLDDTYSTVCRPVGLVDLTRDGVPELLFLELVEYCISIHTNGRIAIFRYGIRFFN